jgi:hypothetical protein
MVRLAHKSVERGFWARLMSPIGSYPAESFIAEPASLIVTPEICFSLERVEADGWSFSEVDSVSPTVIPLLGCILLSGNPGDRYIYPYPTYQTLLLELGAHDDMSDGCISQCRDHLLDHLRKCSADPSPADLIHRPPALGGFPYGLIPEQPSREERRTMLRQIELAGPVAQRGIGSLLKAHMAWQHRELQDAACIFLWVSLDAAHSIVLQNLKQAGTINPTSADAARYFEEISGYGADWEKFFEDDYENRIRAIHPDNRFGAEARPQFLADDFVELNDMLIPLFQFLLSPAADSAANP